MESEFLGPAEPAQKPRHRVRGGAPHEPLYAPNRVLAPIARLPLLQAEGEFAHPPQISVPRSRRSAAGRWPARTATGAIADPSHRLAQRPPPSQYPRAMSETLLDVKGMNCPLPVLRANRALRSLVPGARLRVLATDRAAVADFQAFCRETGHALLAWSEEAGVFSFVIRRRPDTAEKKEA